MGIKHGLSWIGRLDYLEKSSFWEELCSRFPKYSQRGCLFSPPQNAPKQACALPLRSRTSDLFSHLCHKWESSTCFAELGPEAPSHCSSSALYLQHAEHISSHWWPPGYLIFLKKLFFPQWPYFSCCRVGGVMYFQDLPVYVQSLPCAKSQFPDEEMSLCLCKMFQKTCSTAYVLVRSKVAHSFSDHVKLICRDVK